MSNVAMLVDNYFEQAEFVEPKKALEDAGHTVTVVSTGEKTITGMNHAEIADTFTADIMLEDVSFDDYDALVLPGGGINADMLRMQDRAKEWVRVALEQNKPLAVICHAPWVLASANAISGCKLTSFFTIQDDIRNAGGEWVDEEVVVDGSLITSRNPDDIPAFNRALISALS